MQLVSSSSAIVENEDSISNIISNNISNLNNSISSDKISNSSNSNYSNNVNNADSSLNSNSVSNNIESKLVSNDEENTIQTASEVSNTSSFAKLKLDRDEMYSKSIETYQKIIDSENISSEQKSIAVQEIEKINNLKNSIQMAEELIKLKGFEDVVIYSSSEKISVIVRIAALSDTQVAQIQNTVSKELGVKIADITISNK